MHVTFMSDLVQGYFALLCNSFTIGLFDLTDLTFLCI